MEYGKGVVEVHPRLPRYKLRKKPRIQKVPPSLYGALHCFDQYLHGTVAVKTTPSPPVVRPQDEHDETGTMRVEQLDIARALRLTSAIHRELCHH
ncbi:hypothetical protein BDW66DRAFT_130429 [Aspergillus desertorum]